MALQLFLDGAVAQANERLKDLQFLREAQRPAALQARIIIVLGQHARGLVEHSARIQHLEQVHEPDPPRPRLIPQYTLERHGGRPVSPTGVEIHQIDALQAGLSCGCRGTGAVC
jgi:hypothetical protein